MKRFSFHFPFLLVEVFVGLLQVQQDLLSTARRWSTSDLVVDASQELLEQKPHVSIS